MKRTTALLLLILTALCALPTMKSSAKVTETKLYCYRDFQYFFRGDDVQIFDYCGTESKLRIPEKINGHKVVKIGYGSYYENDDNDSDYFYYSPAEAWWHYGFWHNEYIEQVIIPDTVFALGYECFAECPRLRKVTLGKGLKRLDSREFADCNKLKSLKIPDSLEEFNLSSIAGTKITEVKFGKNLKKFDDDFYNQLASISVSKKNRNFSSQNGVLYNKDKTKLVYYPTESRRKTFRVPDSIKTADNIFWTNLKSLYLPKKLTKLKYIGENPKLTNLVFTGRKKITVSKYAVFDCKKLKKVTIPANVVKIGKQAFGFWEYEYKENGSTKFKTKKVKGFTIKGKKNSAAHKYAKKYGFTFIAV